MEEIKKEIEAVYKIISGIPVTGDSVDAVAVVRSKLRNVFAELEKIGNASKAKDGTETGA